MLKNAFSASQLVNKIIFVNRYFYPDLSATSQMVSDLAFVLASQQMAVCVVTSRQMYESPAGLLPPLEVHENVQIFRVWTTRFGRMNLLGRGFDYISFYVAAFGLLLRITQPGDLIVAKTDPPLVSVIAWIVAKAKRATLVNWLQDVFPEVAEALGLLKSGLLIQSLRWLRNGSLRAASMNVVLGERMRERLCAEGVERGSTVVIHNWADGGVIKPVPPSKNALRRAWALQDKFVVGYSGNMGRAHEFDTIIAAMKRLRDEKDTVFLFIGGGAGKEKLERALEEAGSSNFLFRPYQPRAKLDESLSVPDVHLVSLQPQLEGLIVPSKIYGIAAAGRPVIFVGDPDGEIGCMVSTFRFGFAVPVGADGQLVERLQELRQNPDLVARMGNAGRRCLEEYFEKSRGVEAWGRLLRMYIKPS